MGKITYVVSGVALIWVNCDGKRVGRIVKSRNPSKVYGYRWRYETSGAPSACGEWFDTLDACKASLEAE